MNSSGCTCFWVCHHHLKPFPMQRPSPAAQRFYRSFYRWTVLTSSADRQLVSSNSPRASAFHSSSRQDGRKRNTARVPVKELGRKSSAVHISLKHLHLEGSGPTRKIGQKDGRQRHSEASSDKQDVPKAMLEGPVRSAADKSFHLLDAKEYVVRFRSEAGLMLEYAIAGDVLLKKQAKYGKRLERLGNETGARIEVQELLKRRQGAEDFEPQNVLHSLLISGTFKEVVETFNELGNTGRRETAFVSRKKQDGSAIKDDFEYPRAWRANPVQATTDKPSSSIVEREFVVRSRTRTNLTVETLLSDHKTRRVILRFGKHLEFLQFRHGSKITVRDRASSKTNGPIGNGETTLSSSSDHIPSILISGTWQAVFKTYSDLMGAKVDVADEGLIAADFPPGSLPLGKTVFHKRSDDGASLEFSVAEDHWQRLRVDKDFERITSALKVALETGQPEPRISKLRGQVEARSVFVTGPYQALITMRDMFKIFEHRYQKIEYEELVERKHDGHGKEIQPDAKGIYTGDSPDRRSKNLEGEMITAFVEICPPRDSHAPLLGYVRERLDMIRRNTQCFIRSKTGQHHLQLLQGSQSQVDNAKRDLNRKVAEACEMLGIPFRGIRIIKQRPTF